MSEDEYPILERVHEAVAQFRLRTGREPDTVTLHQFTKLQLGRELRARNDGERIDLDNMEVAGCRVQASLTTPKGAVVVSDGR